jgi:hypothetical protein
MLCLSVRCFDRYTFMAFSASMGIIFLSKSMVHSRSRGWTLIVFARIRWTIHTWGWVEGRVGRVGRREIGQDDEREWNAVDVARVSTVALHNRFFACTHNLYMHYAIVDYVLAAPLLPTRYRRCATRPYSGACNLHFVAHLNLRRTVPISYHFSGRWSYIIVIFRQLRPRIFNLSHQCDF